jgi:hypothetical protein
MFFELTDITAHPVDKNMVFSQLLRASLFARMPKICLSPFYIRTLAGTVTFFI